MRRRLRLWGRRGIGILVLLLAGAAVAPRAEVVLVTVGVDSTCPYGVVG